MAYFLVSTEHLENRLWFRDDQDYNTGMNFVAIVANSVRVNVLAFILMSNHVHFVLSCEEEEALLFITRFKGCYSRYVWDKYGEKDFLRRNPVDIKHLDADNESLERAIAYVLMNPVAANICQHPVLYPWGTGDAYFNETPVKGTKICQLSDRARRRILHSKKEIQKSCILGAEGYILPRSYVDTAFVESLYQTPKRMNFFLMSSSKAQQRLEGKAIPSFRDQSLLNASLDLCRTLFRRNSPKELTTEQIVLLLREMRWRFSADINQLSRILGLTYKDAAKLFETPNI